MTELRYWGLGLQHINFSQTQSHPNVIHMLHIKIHNKSQDFPGGPAVRTPSFHRRGPGLTTGEGIRIPTLCAVWQKKKKICIMKHINGATTQLK